MTIAHWIVQVTVVKGSFLKGRYVNGGNLYLQVPEEFKGKYESDDFLHVK
jgi:hypothetical protein